MLRTVTLSVALAAFGWAQDPVAPHSAMEPPAAKAAASLAASTKASPPELLTTGEKSDWNETAPYAEAVEISHRLERASRSVKVLEIGTTPEGRSMIALVVSKDRAFTPEAAARTGKVVILIQSGIHAGEIEGKDTVLMLVRDMAVSKRYAAWLDHAIFVVIPVFNVDGHENFSPYHRPSQNGPKSTGLRANAQRMNLNRDYIKADTPEMRAWLKLFNAWNPDFHIDNHVTDGADFQYDVTWDMARNQDIAEPAGAWVREKFVPELDRRMAADGHLVAPYGALRNVGRQARIFHGSVLAALFASLRGGAEPALAAGGDAQPEGRQDPRLGALRHHAARHRNHPAGSRRAAQRGAGGRSRDGGARRRPQRSAGLPGRQGERQEPPAGLSRAQERPVQKRSHGRPRSTATCRSRTISNTAIHDQIDTTVEAQMPLGYLIPAGMEQRRRNCSALHGVEMERTREAHRTGVRDVSLHAISNSPAARTKAT